jgi:hypothetical protein
VPVTAAAADVLLTLTKAIYEAECERKLTVQLDLADARAIHGLLTSRRPLTGHQAARLESLIDDAWDELAGSELTLISGLQASYGITRRHLAAVRALLGEVEGAEAE